MSHSEHNSFWLPGLGAVLLIAAAASIGSMSMNKNADAPAPQKAQTFDPQAFTRQYDAQEPAPEMPKQQQETVKRVIGLVGIFNRGSVSDIGGIKSHLAGMDFKVTYTENSRPEGGVFHEISGMLNDGSDIAIRFIVDNFDHGFEKTAMISGFNKAQCMALVDAFSQNPKLELRMDRYRDGGYTSSDCGAVTPNGSFKLEARYYADTVGKLTYPDDISADLQNIFKGAFDQVRGHVYFAKNGSAPPFRAYGLYLNDKVDIDYVYDAAKGTVAIGMANKEKCKKILYNLPSAIRSAVNGKPGGSCSELNRIEFSAGG